MKIRRPTTTYGVIVLVALVLGMILVLSIGTNPTNSTPAKDNAPKYPTLAPVKPLSRTVNGYTVTLYQRYANANLIVLTYTVQSSYEDLSKVSRFERLHGEEQSFVVASTLVPVGSTPPLTGTSSPTREDYEPRLTGDGGHVLPFFPYLGWQLPRSTATSSIVFDARQLTQNLPAEVQLHLTLNKAEIPIVDEEGGAIIHQVNGPFIFDFSLPVDPLRRIAEVNQTVITPEGDTITISRVIVTRHDVRVIWRVDGSVQPGSSPTTGFYAYNSYACCTLKLEVGGHSVHFQTKYSGARSESEDMEHLLLDSLLDEQGEWAISAWYHSTHTGSAYYPPRPGPMFRFSVPPAINSLQP